MPNTSKVILFEYDRPISIRKFRNLTSGLWTWYVTPGDITVTDDRGKTGYYKDTNTIIYDIRSINVEGENYTRVYTYANLYSTNKSFFYDRSTSQLSVHFNNFEPPFTFNYIFFGAVVGFSIGNIQGNKPYYNDIYYEQRINKIFGIKRNKDPLFYGILNYSSGNISFKNQDGHFDDWASKNIYNQPERLLFGYSDSAYSEFEQIHTGLVGKYSGNWNEFVLKLNDSRKGLTNKIARNRLSKTHYPYLNDSNVDANIPVAYGTIRKGKCICLNEDETTPAYYSFIFCDTEFHNVSSITQIYVDNVEVSASSSDLTSGTFTLAYALCNENLSDVTIDFVANSIKNGVEIIKDIMVNYAEVPYLSTNYDLTAISADIIKVNDRNDSLYIDDDMNVKEAIEKICVDIDAIFYQSDSGLWKTKIFDKYREPVKKIKYYEIFGELDFDNDSDQFLTSVLIKYNKNQSTGHFESYENNNYETEVFNIYKAYNDKTIETGLSDLASAQIKSENVMYNSKNIKDIIKRTVSFDDNYTLDIMDFIVADFKKRKNANESFYLYEIIGIEKTFFPFKLNLTVRELEPYYFKYNVDFLNDSMTFIYSQELSGTDSTGLFDGMSQSYYKDSEHPDYATLAQYGRVWVYDSALSVYAKLAVKNYDSAKAEIDTLIALMVEEDSRGFNGVLHFSYNTKGDNFVDPKGPLGAVIWVLKAIWAYIYITGDTTHQAYLITKTDWVLTQQVTNNLDDRYGLFRAGLANIVNTDGYTTYVGDPNVQQEHVSIEHNADAIDLFYLAYTVTNDSDYKDAADLCRTEIYNLWQTDHFCTGMAGDGTINTNVAIDNNTWVASAILDYDEDTAWQCINYVYNNFLVTSTSDGGGYAGYYGCKFFDASYSDPYVSPDPLYDTMIQPESTWGFIHLLICFYDKTTNSFKKEFCMDLANRLIYSMVRFKENVTESGYGTAYASIDITNLFSTMESIAGTATGAYVMAEINDSTLRDYFIGCYL